MKTAPWIRSKLTRLAMMGGCATIAIAAAVDANQPDSPAAIAQNAAREVFSKRIRPFFQEYCTGCHGAEKQKGDVNLEVFQDAPVMFQDPDLWDKVMTMLTSKEMPPKQKPQPSEEDRALVVGFIQAELAKFDCTQVPNPGKVTLRRLNRAEYNNTIRDLTGIDFKPAADFPLDEVGYGFDNIGDVLSLSPLLMEKYLDAAEEVVKRAIRANPPAWPPVQRIATESFSVRDEEAVRISDGVIGFYREGDASVDFAFQEAGDYVLKIRAHGEQAGPDPPRLAVKLGSVEVQIIEVRAPDTTSEVHEVPLRVDDLRQRITLAFINNYNVTNHPKPELNGDRNLIVEHVDVVGPRQGTPPALPATHTRIIPNKPLPGTEREEAARILERFAKRAFRRPVSAEEVERMVRLVDLATREGESFEAGIQLAIEAVLTSPHFLFRWELDPSGGTPGQIRSLTDYELASRLSYFLWSSMPDDELFALAELGVLHQPAQLEAQAKRMLRDPKAKALVENFAGQWLQIRNLDSLTPDPGLFPEFDAELRGAMRIETERFFEAIVTEDRSVLEFLDADFTFLNERLARHYGIPDIEGDVFRRVSLHPDSPRGGVLTHASILSLTSNPTRTSPVARGKWILEQILGTPPPPPPPNAGELEETAQANQSGSLRQRTELHRSKPECASCHDKMDPLGFAFENFDAIGAWRETDGKFPIDSSGILPDGRAFHGPKQIKSILKSEDAFVRTFTGKMLTFALGRGLQYYDRCSVNEIFKALGTHGYRFSTLITEIVISGPFNQKRLEGN